MHQDLVIHSEVRDWVFIPLTLLIIMMNMLRQYAHIVRRSRSDCSPPLDSKYSQVEQFVCSI